MMMMMMRRREEEDDEMKFFLDFIIIVLLLLDMLKRTPTSTFRFAMERLGTVADARVDTIRKNLKQKDG